MGIDQQEKSKAARKEVMLTHAIDIFGLPPSAPPEMSIVYNLFLKKFRLI
jgi:hypothetical protein